MRVARDVEPLQGSQHARMIVPGAALGCRATLLCPRLQMWEAFGLDGEGGGLVGEAFGLDGEDGGLVGEAFA